MVAIRKKGGVLQCKYTRGPFACKGQKSVSLVIGWPIIGLAHNKAVSVTILFGILILARKMSSAPRQRLEEEGYVIVTSIFGLRIIDKRLMAY